jgi:hypothetical protein
MCRVSFEGVQVFLCTFNVLQAWLKNMHFKLSIKARARRRSMPWFAACSRPGATQHKTCKHQVAWFVSLAPAEHKPDAERLVLSCLGTLLGFAGGCTMESTLDVSVALKNLWPVATDLPVSEPQPPAAAEHDESSDGAAGSDDRGCWPRLFGFLTLNNHRWELRTLLEECLRALNKADPGMQHSLVQKHKALLVRA